MPATEAQIRANQANAARSTGPKTADGKEKSRRNSYKHGMTGTGVVLPVEEASEVESRFASFSAELQVSGLVGQTLARRLATLSVRMERCAEGEMLAVAEQSTRAMLECEIPEDASDAEAALVRADAARIASIQASKELTLLRRYEAAAERGFYRALKELRLAAKLANAVEPAPEPELDLNELGSFFQGMNALNALKPEPTRTAAPVIKTPVEPTVSASRGAFGGVSEVPFTIGRAR